MTSSKKKKHSVYDKLKKEFMFMENKYEITKNRVSISM